MIAVLADTHMPRGPRRLPDRCTQLLAEAEAVIHAGDFTGRSVLDELEALCPRVYAVRGNVDEAVLRSALPETLEVRVRAWTVGVIHDAGPSRGRLARLRARFPHPDAVVFAHRHLPLHESDGGFQIFNPGSPTERRRAPGASMGVLSCDGPRLAFDHVWL